MLTPLLALAMRSPDPSTGSVLYSDCKTYIAMIEKTKETSGEALMQGGMCVGYISGFIEGAGQRLGFCVNGVTVNTMARVYVVYMNKNPKLFDSPRAVALSFALDDAYSCGTK